MGISRLTVEEFLKLAKRNLVFDVRSPSEYVHAHIPGAINIPLFEDEERKVVGTDYKQVSREAAIKTGLTYFGPKMRSMVEQVEACHKAARSEGRVVLVHCWRGGMRSGAVAWLLDLYGFKVYTLDGGYKAYRNWALGKFAEPFDFKVIGGYTGSGKTMVLQELGKNGETIIDLEGMAVHKGSAFGDIAGHKQPSQEMFENILALRLAEATQRQNELGGEIWIEDESQRIGLVNLPAPLWQAMRKAPVYFLEIPFEERLANIVDEYGKIPKYILVNAIIRIQKRLGGLDTKMAVNYLLEGNTTESFRILLRYYDKHYLKGLQSREPAGGRLEKIPCNAVNFKLNAEAVKKAQTK